MTETPQAFSPADFFGRMAADAVNDVVFTVDQEGRVLFVNEAVAAVFGVERDRVLGQRFFGLLAQPERDQYRVAFERYAETGERRLAEWRGLRVAGRHTNGHQLDLEVSFDEFQHRGDRFFTAVVRGLGNTNLALSDGDRDRYRKFVEESLGLMCCHDLDGILIAVNPPAATALGYEVDELLGRNLKEFVAPELIPEVNAYLEAVAQDGFGTGVTRFIGRGDRELVWHFQNTLREDSDGTSYVIGHALDITKQVEAQETLRDSEQRLQLLVDQMPAVLWTTDTELRFTSSQGAGLAGLGLTPDEAAGVSIYDYFETEDPDFPAIAAHRRALKGESVDYDIEWQGRSYLTHIEPLRDRHGEITGVVGVARDASERKRAEDATRRALSLLTATLESTADGLLVVDTGGRISSFNRKFLEMWSLTEGDLGSDERAIAMVLDQLEEPDAFLHRVKTLYSQPEADSFDVIRFKDGRVVERFSQPQRIDGDVVGRVWSFRDITEQRRAEDRIQRQAFHDALTDLPNRQLVRDRLEVALATARRHQTSIGVLFLDLDSFKLVNDTFGHSVGDELLRAVSDRLKEELRAGDTLGRLGGDEFTLVLNDLRRGEDAVAMADRIRATFSKPFVLSSATVPMTASIGVSFSLLAGEDVEFLLQSADAAMYLAKDHGGNTVQLATADLNLKTWRRASLVNRLRRALENDEFEVRYQPIVNLAKGGIVGAEALIRWRDPEEGLIPPADFISIAEETHVIVPMGRWVLEKACNAAAGWQEICPGMRVAVNLSLRQFQRPGLRKTVTRVLQESGLEPQLLELEVAESVAMLRAEYAIHVLTALRELGVRISIDDFGTGQTSLSYLQRLPMDTLKVDRALIRDVCESDQAAVIVACILEMAHGLGLDTVAEGVETPAQNEYLTKRGCHRAQGFFYGKPMRRADLERILHGG